MKNQLPAMNKKESRFGFIFLFLQFLVIPLLVEIINLFLHRAMSQTLQQFLCFALSFLFACAIFHNYLLTAVKQLSQRSPKLLLYIFLYLGLYYTCTVLVNLLIFFVDPGFSNANDTALGIMFKDHFTIMAIGTVILVPPVEEILYRGVLFGKLYTLSPFLGYLISTIIFSAIHVIGYVGTVPAHRLLLCFLQYVPAGFFLSRVFVKTGNIFAPIIMHAIINFIGIHSI